MIATTFAGQAVRILQAPPNWAERVQSSHELVLGSAASLSNREGRRPHAAALRSSISFHALGKDASLRALHAALRGLGKEPVLCPFWPAARSWAQRAAAPIQGGLNLVWTEDWATWDLYTTVEPGWPAAGDNWAPVLWGVLGDRGDQAGLSWYNSRLADLTLSVTEDGPAEYALTPAAGTVTAGPLPPAGWVTAPRLLPFVPHFERLSESISLRIDRQDVGFRRQRPAEFYPQAAVRIQELGYQLRSASQAAALMAFLRDYAGRGSAFWAPSWVSAAVLTAAVSSGDTVLQVADTAGVLAGDYLALIHDGQTIGRRVTAVGSGTVTLSAAVGVDLPKAALVSHLILGRLDRPALSLDWTHGALAETSLRIRELPTEYVPGADETVGTTLGQLPERCYLYDFTRDHGGTLLHDRYTSHESDVTYGGHTWVSAPISHGAIEHGMALDSGRIELRSQVFDGNPLVALATLRTEVPVRLTMMAGDVAAGVATGVQILAAGEVDKAALRGERITGYLSPGGRLLSQQAPRFEVGPSCNHALFSVGCGLVRASWQHTALINGAPTAAYPFSVALDGLARTTGPTPTWFADWFAHGVLEIGTTGAAGWQRRWILTSTAPVSGALTVQLHKPLDPLPADNAAVVLYPGCDLTEATCRAYHASTNPRGKFDNFAAFGGHPQVPASNPSLVKLSSSLGGGKK
ncbi:MAG: phage BR0599 family protein [Verrucomicrobia bacterium]|nr:phage BR0599 family protein [Verrucomicrobiota bacterium]